MSVRWSVYLDQDDDGQAEGPAEDLGAAALELRWRRGMAQPWDSVAQPGHAEITLRNEDGRFSPERNALPPGRLLQIRSHDGSQQRTHFTGHISRVEPAPDGERRVVLHAHDAGAQLAGHHVRLPPLRGQRTDQIIARCLDAVPLRRRRLRNIWVLARRQQSELGRNTRLPTRNIQRNLQPDPDRQALAGDTWTAGIPALTAIGEICSAGRGRFFIDHEGQARYLTRRQLLRADPPQARFRDDMQGLRQIWGDERVSQVEVLLTPRRQGAPDTVLWQLGQALAIARGSDSTQLLLRYRDAQGRPCGALEVSEPVARFDWYANARPDGQGEDLSDQLLFRLLEAGISAARVELRNRSRATAWLQAGARLRGTPVHTGDPLLVSEHSLTSEVLYGPATLRLALPAAASLERARALARHELARRSRPRSRVHSLTLNARAVLERALPLRLFARIRVEETHGGHRGDYFIIGEEQQVRAGRSARLTWLLERADNPFWHLGRGRLNRDARLAW